MLMTRTRWIALGAVLAAIVGTTVALAGGPARITPSPKSTQHVPGPATPPAAAAQHKLRQRLASARHRIGARARAASADITARYGVFLSAARAGDHAPNAQVGDDSRLARRASAPVSARTAASVDVYLAIRKGDLCILAGGGAGCGPINGDLDAPVLALTESDRSAATIWGAASDDITVVQVTSTTGQTINATPSNNVYEADVTGQVQTIRFTHRNGAVTDLYTRVS